MTKEALKLALEALEWINRVNAMDYEYQQKAREALNAIKEALAEPEQEPVAWADHGVVNWIADKQFKHASLLYTTPPQRTWVDLSDEEIETIYANCNAWDKFEYERMLEAKLKDKNT